MDINELIQRFKRLDLTTYPESEIRYLFSQLGTIGYIQVTFHPGKVITRARPNFKRERFNKKSDYSFKPQEYNTTYQRASTPNRTMFYGTIIPENLKEGELDNMRVVGVLESVPLLRDKNSSGYEKISFGRWEVTEDINLVAIVHEERYHKVSSYTRELHEAFQGFIHNAPAEVVSRSMIFQTYLAEQFSNEDIRGDYDYMVSAIFSEIVINMGYDGILFPSVRNGGKGFNVAITPEAATNKLSLRVAGECSIYKLKEHAVVGNDAIVELNGDETEFILTEIDNHRADCLEQLGVKSIDDLLKAGTV